MRLQRVRPGGGRQRRSLPVPPIADHPLPAPLRVVVDGAPIPQGRPRFTTQSRNGQPLARVHTYDPPRSRLWKQHVAWRMRQTAPAGPFTGRLVITACVFRVAPDVLDEQDVDNLLKAVMDAGNGVLWVSDAQIHRVSDLAKLPASPTQPPGVVLDVAPLPAG